MSACEYVLVFHTCTYYTHIHKKCFSNGSSYGLDTSHLRIATNLWLSCMQQKMTNIT